MTTFENPITKERERLGLTRMDLAAKCDLSPWPLQCAEQGITKTLSPKLLDYFKREGVDVDRLQADYHAYRLQVQAAPGGDAR